MRLVLINIAAWLVFHLGTAWLATRVAVHRFDPAAPLYRPRRWERGGRFYERTLGIRAWKDRLPDGARLFRGGFSKRALAQPGDARYLELFVRETCRAELAHWVVFALAAPFFLWNPAWAGWAMVLYAIAANLPCIAAQRYNRLRLARLLSRRRPGAG
jgi:glycosyl-4,4'-diaponeurosporenoate acyltransferase